MASGWKDDQLAEADLPRIARRMRERFQRLHEKVNYRRKHRYNDDDVDPSVSEGEGNTPDPDDPFRQIRGMQVDILRRKSTEFVSRVVENPWQFSVKPPDKTQALERTANDIAQVFTYWATDDEDRQGERLLDVIAECATRDAYAVFHDLRCEHYWPEIDWLPGADDGMADDDIDVECPGCGGQGQGSDGVNCPQCDGSGRVTQRKTFFKGRAKSYVEALTREYADRGSPWQWGVDDVLNIAWDDDKDPRGGFRRLLVTYEVAADEYEEEVGAEALRAAMPLPGVTLGQYGSVGNDTPNSGIEGDARRIQVNQLWTRSHYYEWIEGGGPQGMLVKSGRHNYQRIPYYLVAPLDTHDTDLVRRFESPLDGLYRLKEWADRQLTLMSGVVENQARPLMRDTMADPSVSPLTADGSPAEDAEGTLAARYSPPGVTTQVISQPMPASLPQFAQMLREMLEEAAPDTGKADAGATSAAWAVRLVQQQASTLPRRFVAHIARVIQVAMKYRMRWHMENAQRVIGYGESNRNKPVVVMPGDLKNHQFVVFINPVSGAERITAVEHNRGLLQEQLILPRDFYEAMGEEDPDDAAARVEAYYLAQPFRQARAKAMMAKAMGSAFLLGPGLEMLDAQGNGVSPEQVLAAKGYQPARGGGADGNMLSQIRQQVQMPALQPLERNQPGVPEQTTGLVG